MLLRLHAQRNVQLEAITQQCWEKQKDCSTHFIGHNNSSACHLWLPLAPSCSPQTVTPFGCSSISLCFFLPPLLFPTSPRNHPIILTQQFGKPALEATLCYHTLKRNALQPGNLKRRDRREFLEFPIFTEFTKRPMMYIVYLKLYLGVTFCFTYFISSDSLKTFPLAYKVE